jgi:hypothetical protein
MNLVDLAYQRGLKPKWVASTQGGEYHSSCPLCGGNDRFVIQPNKQMKNCKGYYFCRQCNIHGDSIQFCRDYLGCTNFKEAINLLGIEIIDTNSSVFVHKKSKNSFVSLNRPSNRWLQQASIIIEEAHRSLLSRRDILESLNQRGLPIEVVKRYKIGFIPLTETFDGILWGLEKEKIWFPAGILIPTIERDQSVIRLKIRRKDWHSIDKLPKYIAVSGSMGGLNIIGDKKNPILIVVESELDAYALNYVLGDIAVIVAVGGCTKNPDSVTDYLAKNKTLLVCHDNDEAGINMLNKWKELYPHARAYPTALGKDIGEAITQGIDLRAWIITGLPDQVKKDLCLTKEVWNSNDQYLIDWILNYISQRTITRYAYSKLEEEIKLGPNSPRAKTGELQNMLKLMKQLIEEVTMNENEM